jgi:hypothetical protein
VANPAFQDDAFQNLTAHGIKGFQVSDSSVPAATVGFRSMMMFWTGGGGIEGGGGGATVGRLNFHQYHTNG